MNIVSSQMLIQVNPMVNVQHYGVIDVEGFFPLSNTTKPKNCKCGKPLSEATFLSNDFGWNGGEMVFTCECGTEEFRTFTPMDKLPIEEQFRLILSEEMSEEMVNNTIRIWKLQQMEKKLK